MVQYGPSTPPYFSVLHPIKGQYEITFNQPFIEPPAVVVQHVWNVNVPDDPGGSTLDNANIEGLGADRFVVETGNGSGDVEDRDFTFIAVGNLP
jgi:hypothetical protein